jgi:subtilisin family serine protease
MLSKAVGRVFGASKNAAVTVVRAPKPILTAEEAAAGGYDFRMETLINSLRKVLQDIGDKGLEYKSVVSMSLGYEDSLHKIPEPGDYDYPFYAAIEALIKAKAVVVAASGNAGQFKRGNPPAGMPQSPGPVSKITDHRSCNPSLTVQQILNPLAKVMSDIPAVWNGQLPIITVGAVDNRGIRLDLTQFQENPNFPYSKVDVYAPGGIQNCTEPGRLIARSEAGTSICKSPQSNRCEEKGPTNKQ